MNRNGAGCGRGHASSICGLRPRTSKSWGVSVLMAPSGIDDRIDVNVVDGLRGIAGGSRLLGDERRNGEDRRHERGSQSGGETPKE